MPKQRSASAIQQKIAEYERRVAAERDRLRTVRDQAKPRGRYAFADWARENRPAVLKEFIAALEAEKRLGVLEDVRIWLGDRAAGDGGGDPKDSARK